MWQPVLLLLLSASIALADKNDDLISELPGLTFTPTFNQYSGFLDATPGNKLHYWFVEAQTNAQNAPLVLWLNGGPGCSSLLGLLTELGPYRVSADGTQLLENVHSWNKAANILFLESPRDIGFSYRDNATYGFDSLYNDDKTATDNALALQQFFLRFPEYNNRPFYITGESYGGVYVPTLTKLVIQMITNGTLPSVNLVGMAVGNGALSRPQLTNSVIDLLYYRGMLGVSQFENLRQCCPDSPQGPLVDCNFSKFVFFDNYGNAYPRNDTLDQQEIACGKMVSDLAQNAVWGTYNDVYNTYIDCYNFTGTGINIQAMKKAVKRVDMRTAFSSSAKARQGSNAYSMFSSGANPFVDQGAKINEKSTDSLKGFSCYVDDVTTAYLNRDDVRKALHIPDQVQPWQECNDDINEKYYIQQTPDTTDVFKFFVDSKYPLKVLIYNGDVDLACNYLGDQWFVENLATAYYQFNLTSPRNSWNYTRPGGYHPQLAGYVKSWSYDKFSIDLLTVKGAGHLVPMDRPAPALQMFHNFLNGNQYNSVIPYSLSAQPIKSAYKDPTPAKLWTRKQADRIWSLPGLTYGINFKQYSGYLNGVTGNYLHYWFVESQNNPSTDPLVLWLTGGPGCSGLMALLIEQGPFHPNPDGKTLFENVYAWNKAANILFIESPRGVGFSVQDRNLNNDTIYDDNRTARDTYLALKDFIVNVYPEYIGRPFFVTGESYGGVYVPTLTSLLIDEIQAGNFPQLNLQGMAVGNGELSAIHQLNSAIQMGYFHGLYGKEEWDQLQQCCNSTKNDASWFEYCDFSQYVNIDTTGTANPKDNSFCAQIVADLGQTRLWTGNLNDIYNIYQDCYQQDHVVFGSRIKNEHKKRVIERFVDQGAKVSVSTTDNQGGFQCYATDGAANYLNSQDVRAALHVDPSVGNWSSCDDTINENYVQLHNDTGNVFDHMISSGYPLRVLIYNGDVDQACNYLGDQWFIESFATRQNLVVKKRRDAWRYMTQIAGYAKSFSNNNQFSVDLLTVKGAGHMVPTDRPGPALQMFANFIRNQDYSNPTIYDNTLHPLKTTYRIAARFTDAVNGTGTAQSLAYKGNRVDAKKKRVARALLKEKSETAKVSNAADIGPPDVHTKDQDEIKNLPGLTYNINFKQYSGYLSASKGNYLHYWLTESQLNASGDPLILWLNGGPGCSSLGGLFEELGPFHVNQDGSTIFENVFSWNKAGNVLFLEAPRDVGFSYRSNDVDPDSMYNDTYTAADTVVALASFFDRFPEYKGRKFFITGESYGGVYVPTLTAALIHKIQSGEMSYVNLVGVAIGNGELSELQQVNSAVSLLYFRGERDKSDWDALNKCCDTSKPQTYCDFTSYITLDVAGNAWPKETDTSTLAGQCGQLVVQQGFNDVWMTDNDVYNTFLDCYDTPEAADAVLSERISSRRTKRSALPPLINTPLFVNQAKKVNYGSTDSNGGFSCFSGSAAQAYLNNADVRKAINIPSGFGEWTDCNDVMNENYIQMHNDTTSVFQEIMQTNYPLQFLIYNGDVDMACQFLGDQWFMEKLAGDNNMAVSRARGAWNFTQGQYLPRTGGYWKQFNYNNSQIVFDLLTVKGAGHFVPQDRPGPALQMIYNFVNGYDYSKNLTLDISRKQLLDAYKPAETTIPRKLADRVFDLPGLTFTPNFAHHSGYLSASTGNYLFYWLLESQSAGDNDPVILWLQGGPGCASTGGLFSEIGPFYVNPDGQTLFENVYSWNKNAHVLIIDSPRSIGFSYQDNSTNQDNDWNDDKTALDTALALEDFFSTYDNFASNPFFIAGESYGGIYVPTLTRLLIQRIQNGTSKINLQGMSVGNGLLSAVQDVRTLPDFLYFHGIYDRPQWEKLRKCCPSDDTSYYCNYDFYVTIDDQVDPKAKKFDNQTLQDCANLVEQLSYDRNWAAFYNQYNLYQDCYAQPRDSTDQISNVKIGSRLDLLPKIHQMRSNNAQTSYSNVDPSIFDPLSTDSNGGYSCYSDEASYNYLNLPHVRSALHIPDFVGRWSFCKSINYHSLYNDTTPIFEDILNSGYNLRVLIYNGDIDSVCSMFEAQSMINNFAIAQKFVSPQARTAWTYAQQIGGYVQKWQKNNLTIDILTVKGAGHMVPSDRPGPAQQMILNFVNAQPNYNTSLSFDFSRQPLLGQFTEQPSGDSNSSPAPSQSTTKSPTGPTNAPSTGSTASSTSTVPTTTSGVENYHFGITLFISSILYFLL